MKKNDTRQPPSRSATETMAMGMDMLLKVEGREGDYKSKLVGIKQEECIIVSAPRSASFLDAARPGAGILVRYISEGSVFGFTTSVIGVISKPVPLLFISHPLRLERHDLRKAPRVDCFIPCTVHTPTRSYSCHVVDLSEGGCRTNGPAAAEDPASDKYLDIAAGDCVLLEMLLCEDRQRVIARCEVRTRQDSPELLTMGLNFQSMEPQCAQRLEHFVELARRYS